MNPITWIVKLFTHEDASLHIGSRVKTPYGYGTVTGGSLQIDLDPGSRFRQHKWQPRVNITTNLAIVRPV